MWWELSSLTLSRLTADCTIDPISDNQKPRRYGGDEDEAFEKGELAGEIGKWRTGGEWVGWT